MKIAFTTSDNVHINAHFGSAKQIDIYEVSTDGYQFLTNINFDGDLKEDGNENKIDPKLEVLADCTIVYVVAIGGSAAARLINKGVTPIKAQSEDDKIAEVLDNFVRMLKGNPPPWLRKALQKKTVPNFDEVEEESLV